MLWPQRDLSALQVAVGGSSVLVSLASRGNTDARGDGTVSTARSVSSLLDLGVVPRSDDHSEHAAADIVAEGAAFPDTSPDRSDAVPVRAPSVVTNPTDAVLTADGVEPVSAPSVRDTAPATPAPAPALSFSVAGNEAVLKVVCCACARHARRFIVTLSVADTGHRASTAVQALCNQAAHASSPGLRRVHLAPPRSRHACDVVVIHAAPC